MRMERDRSTAEDDEEGIVPLTPHSHLVPVVRAAMDSSMPNYSESLPSLGRRSPLTDTGRSFPASATTKTRSRPRRSNQTAAGTNRLTTTATTTNISPLFVPDDSASPPFLSSGPPIKTVRRPSSNVIMDPESTLVRPPTEMEDEEEDERSVVTDDSNGGDHALSSPHALSSSRSSFRRLLSQSTAASAAPLSAFWSSTPPRGGLARSQRHGRRYRQRSRPFVRGNLHLPYDDRDDDDDGGYPRHTGLCYGNADGHSLSRGGGTCLRGPSCDHACPGPWGTIVATTAWVVADLAYGPAILFPLVASALFSSSSWEWCTTRLVLTIRDRSDTEKDDKHSLVRVTARPLRTWTATLATETLPSLLSWGGGSDPPPEDAFASHFLATLMHGCLLTMLVSVTILVPTYFVLVYGPRWLAPVYHTSPRRTLNVERTHTAAATVTTTMMEGSLRFSWMVVYLILTRDLVWSSLLDSTTVSTSSTSALHPAMTTRFGRDVSQTPPWTTITWQIDTLYHTRLVLYCLVISSLLWLVGMVRYRRRLTARQSMSLLSGATSVDHQVIIPTHHGHLDVGPLVDTSATRNTTSPLFDAMVMPPETPRRLALDENSRDPLDIVVEEDDLRSPLLPANDVHRPEANAPSLCPLSETLRATRPTTALGLFKQDMSLCCHYFASCCPRELFGWSAKQQRYVVFCRHRLSTWCYRRSCDRVLAYELALLTVILWIPALCLPMMELKYGGWVPNPIDTHHSARSPFSHASLAKTTVVTLGDVPRLLLNPSVAGGDSWGARLFVNGIALVMIFLVPLLSACLAMAAWLGPTSETRARYRDCLYALQPALGCIIYSLVLIVFIGNWQSKSLRMGTHIANGSMLTRICDAILDVTGVQCFDVTVQLQPGAWFALAQAAALEGFVACSINMVN